MKSKVNSISASKKSSVAVPDLKARKNPKGGAPINTSRSNIKRPGLVAGDANTTMQDVATTR